jgi:hypothetical protein
MMRIAIVFVAGLLGLANIAPAQDVPADYQQVLTYLGRTGDYKANVLKVNIPRNDLSVTVAGVKTPTPFGFGGWLGLTKGQGMDVMMGDLVLTQDQVNPVMSALLDNGLDVTAVHNHFFWEEPRIFYMHVHGHGAPMDLAKKVKPALDLIGPGTPPAAAAPPAPPSPGLDDAKLAQSRGPRRRAHRRGLQDHGRSRRSQDHRDGRGHQRPDGAQHLGRVLPAPMRAPRSRGTSRCSQGSDPVLKALRANGLQVVAIHHHMTGTDPTIFFLHYWGTGPAAKLAAGFKAALDQLAK